jgi:hypothetical protein
MVRPPCSLLTPSVFSVSSANLATAGCSVTRVCHFERPWPGGQRPRPLPTLLARASLAPTPAPPSTASCRPLLRSALSLSSSMSSYWSRCSSRGSRQSVGQNVLGQDQDHAMTGNRAEGLVRFGNESDQQRSRPWRRPTKPKTGSTSKPRWKHRKRCRYRQKAVNGRTDSVRSEVSTETPSKMSLPPWLLC